MTDRYRVDKLWMKNKNGRAYRRYIVVDYRTMEDKSKPTTRPVAYRLAGDLNSAKRVLSILKNTRVEEKESVTGRIRSRVVTTWEVVEEGGRFISEHDRRRDAVEALAVEMGRK